MHLQKSTTFFLLIPLVLDQVSKFLMRSLEHAQLNQAGILGKGTQFNWILIMSFSLALVVWNYTQIKKMAFLEKIGWLIIISSGFSNLIDRLIWGGVWDWIVYPVLNVVGNIADILLGLGFLLIGTSYLIHKVKNQTIRVK